MADEPQDPPIGTAQNAADVARKAERSDYEANAIRNMIVQSVLNHKLPWTEDEIANAYSLARTPDLTPGEFRAMLAYLSFCQDARNARS